MAMSRIEADLGKCIGAGMCVLAAPDHFDQRDEDGKVVILQETPDAADLPDVERAVELCPAAAIWLAES